MTDSDPSEYSDKEVGKRFAEVSDMGLVPIEALKELVDDLEQSEQHMASQGVYEHAEGIKDSREKVETLIEDHE